MNATSPIKWLLAGLLLSLLPVCAAQAGTPWPAWVQEHKARPVAPATSVREAYWTLVRGPGVADRIGLHRYRGTGRRQASVLYLPGTNMNGDAAPRDEDHNLLLYLAARGVDVYALDYRTHFVAPETAPQSLGFMRDWGASAFAEDARAALRQVRRDSGDAPVYVAGFSRGVFFAYALALQEPAAVAGVVVLDGYFKAARPDPGSDPAAAWQKLRASERWASDVGGSRGYPARQALMQAVAADPDAASPDPAYPNAGALLAHVLQSAWGPGALANPEGGVSRPQVLARLMVGYDRYYPAVQDVEGKSIGNAADDPDSALDDGWGKLRQPVLYFSSTGMGPDWQANVAHSARASGSPRVEGHVLEGYGHLDVLVAESARQQVYQPLLDWLLQQQAPR